MKKLFALIVALTMVLALAACTEETEVVVAQSDAPQTAAPVETPAAPPSDQPAAEDIAALASVLEELTESVRPGSSGCSLRAVISAAALLDWGGSTAMDSEQISAAVNAWTAGLDEETLAIFSDSLVSVSDTCQQLRQENAPDLLDSAGCRDSAYPWSDEAYAAAQSVFDAAGI